MTYQDLSNDVWVWSENIEFAFGESLALPAFSFNRVKSFWPFAYLGWDYFSHDENESYRSGHSNNPFTVTIYHSDTVHLVTRFPIRKGFSGYMSPLTMTCWVYVVLSVILVAMLLHSSVNKLPFGFIRTSGFGNAMFSPIQYFLSGEPSDMLEKSFTHLTSGRLLAMSLMIGGTFINIIYNLDLRTYIVEPIFETLLQSYEDLLISDMNTVVYAFPVDIDQFHLSWIVFHHDHDQAAYREQDLSALLNEDPKTAMLLTKEIFLYYNNDFRINNSRFIPHKLHLPNYDKVHFYFATRKHFDSLNRVLNQFLLHIQVTY